MATKLLEDLPSQTTFDKDKRPNFDWIRWLQSVADLFSRPVANRVTVLTNATAVNCNGAVQSTGIGAGPITPVRYAEHLVMARITFNESAAGLLFVYVYRTTGAIPANGAAPNAGDVAVGGDAFAGPADVIGQNFSGAMALFDTGLAPNQAYNYYLAVKGPNAAVANLINASQLQVSEF
jgi:hypothetical protein